MRKKSGAVEVKNKSSDFQYRGVVANTCSYYFNYFRSWENDIILFEGLDTGNLKIVFKRNKYVIIRERGKIIRNSKVVDTKYYRPKLYIGKIVRDKIHISYEVEYDKRTMKRARFDAEACLNRIKRNGMLA